MLNFQYVKVFRKLSGNQCTSNAKQMLQLLVESLSWLIPSKTAYSVVENNYPCCKAATWLRLLQKVPTGK